MPIDASTRALRLRSELGASLAPDFEVLRLLGEGSTACVFVARDVALDKTVTVKVLDPELARTPEERIRFERAARAAANIEHPNVVTVHRFGVLPAGEPFVVMQYVHGRTLAQLLAAEGALDLPRVRALLADVADALAAAHASGVVHRDVRPDNVLVTETDERALLADFGLAGLTETWGHARSPRVTKTGQVLGDPLYLSPEQAAGQPVTEATDVYSLAMVALEMIAPRSRQEGARLSAYMDRARGADVQIPAAVENADPKLAALLRSCLQTTPELRPAARTVARRLRDARARDGSMRDGVVSDGDPWAGIPAPVRDGWSSLARRRVPQWVAGTGGAGALATGLVSDSTDNVTAVRVVLATAVVAVLIAGVLAWFHGERGEQRFRPLEIALLVLLLLAWITTLILLVT